MSTRASNFLAAAFAVAVASVIASNLYNYAISKWTAEAAYQMQQTLLQHTAEAPNRYRLLVPGLVDLLSRLVPIGSQPLLSFLVGYFLYYQISTMLALVVLLLYLRQWYSFSQALVGILIVAVSMLVAFGDGNFQPWSLLEIGLFTAGLLAIYRSQRVWLAVLVALATLNRETGVFLAVAYLVIHVRRTRPFVSRADLAWTGLYVLIWASLYAGVRLWLGPAPGLSLAEIQQMNLQPGALLLTAVNGFLFLGVFWVFVWRGRQTADPFIRATWRIVPLYLLAVLVFGVWVEVRLITPLYPILISTGISAWNVAAQRGTDLALAERGRSKP